MKDLRNYTEIIKETVRKINETALWKWTVRVNKQEIKMTNGYIKGFEQDYFSIKYFDYSDPEDDFEMEGLDAYDCGGEKCAFATVGPHHWEDGTIEQCLVKAIHECHYYFTSRY